MTVDPADMDREAEELENRAYTDGYEDALCDLLTDAEHDLVAALGACVVAFGRVIKADDDNDPDVVRADAAEFVGHIHACQQQVLSQAAARAYPGRYRLLGAYRLSGGVKP